MIGGREPIVVPCTIDIENTLDSLHAYVELQGIEVGPPRSPVGARVGWTLEQPGNEQVGQH